MPTYYELLNLKENASEKEIKKAYRNFSKLYHPDRFNGDSQIYLNGKFAYEILINPEKRKKYDFKLNEERKMKNNSLEVKLNQNKVIYKNVEIIVKEIPIVYKKMEIKQSHFGKNKK